MTRTLLLCLALFASSGCVVSRTLVLPDVTPSLDAPEVTARWKVTDVVARSKTHVGAGNDLRDFAPLKDQLEARLRHTLEAQAGLGHRAEGSDYAVELQVDVGEQSGLNPWLALGLSLETGVLLGGAAVGLAVGGPPGSLLGMLVATPIAVVSALVPPSTTELGELEATLVLRRVGGPAIATRHVRSSWRKDLNNFAPDSELAKASGAAVPDFEQRLLEELRQVLREAEASNASAETTAR